MYEPCRLLEASRGKQVPKVRLPQVSAEGCWSRRCMESIQEISHTITGIYIFVVFAFQNFQHCSVSHSFSFISSFYVTKQKLDLYHQSQVRSNITVGLHSVPVGSGGVWVSLFNTPRFLCLTTHLFKEQGEKLMWWIVVSTVNTYVN